MGRDGPVGIATRYGLHGPEIESLCGQDFPHPSRPVLGPTQRPIQWILCLSWSIAAWTWRWPLTISSTDVKESVELYLYSPSGPSWPVLGWTLNSLVISYPVAYGAQASPFIGLLQRLLFIVFYYFSYILFSAHSSNFDYDSIEF